jgi:translation initiation factor 1
MRRRPKREPVHRTMSRKKDRIDTAGGSGLAQDNPFGGLELGGLKPGPAKPVEPREKKIEKPVRKKETLHVRRLKSGKGGKVVTELSGFDADPGTLSRLLKSLQGQLGTGGTCKGKIIELQGECRERVKPLLEERGYRVKGV